MTRDNLKKILQAGVKLPLQDFAFDRMYEPEYHMFYMNLEEIQSKTSFLVFNPETFGFNFKKCIICASGIEILFTSSNFDKISVSVHWDRQQEKIFNYVLITPFFTEKDWNSNVKIHQVANKIQNEKDLTKYITRLRKRFVCPVKSESNAFK